MSTPFVTGYAASFTSPYAAYGGVSGYWPEPKPRHTLYAHPAPTPPTEAALKADEERGRLTGEHIARTALRFFNRSSEDGPDRGNLACAYMVNKVLKAAIGKTYGEDPDTVNSVRMDILRQGGQLIPTSMARPGDIALSYNYQSLMGVGGGTAHSGIYVDRDRILANSSERRQFNQIFSSDGFAQLYPFFEVIRLPEALP